MQEKRCHCGKLLTGKQKKTCSRKCQHELYRIRGQGKNEVELTCAFCGKIFRRKRYMVSKDAKYHYCDVKCSDEHKKETMIGNQNFDHSPEHYERLSRFMKNKWVNDNEYRKIIINALRKGCDLSHEHESCDKRKKTMTIDYGVDHGFKTSNNRKSCNSRKAHEKRHRTMKKNGSYGKSKIEDAFYDSLCEIFGDDVERQVLLNGWNIDFKIGDVYVQFDGVYWHGLNRPITEIKSSENLRDETILKTYYRDLEQNVWCEECGIKLIRITDTQYSAMTNDEIREVICG